MPRAISPFERWPFTHASYSFAAPRNSIFFLDSAIHGPLSLIYHSVPVLSIVPDGPLYHYQLGGEAPEVSAARGALVFGLGVVFGFGALGGAEISKATPPLAFVRPGFGAARAWDTPLAIPSSWEVHLPLSCLFSRAGGSFFTLNFAGLGGGPRHRFCAEGFTRFEGCVFAAASGPARCPLRQGLFTQNSSFVHPFPHGRAPKGFWCLTEEGFFPPA